MNQIFYLLQESMVHQQNIFYNEGELLYRMFDTVYCFTGNPYLIREKIRSWKASFIKKHQNDMNIVSLFYEPKQTMESLRQEIESLPFLSPYKLIFVYGFLDTRKNAGNDDEEDMNGRFKQMEISCVSAPPTSIIVFVSSSPDKRRGLFKKIPQNNIKNFRVDKNFLIHDFDDQQRTISVVDFFLARTTATIDAKMFLYLLHSLMSDRHEEGVDLFLLSHELQKLESYTGGRSITQEDIDLVVTKMFSSKIFAFTDALGKGSAKDAIAVMQSLLQAGEEIYAFWGLMMGHFRRLLMIKTLLEDQKPHKTIQSFLGAASFKTDDMISQAKQFTLAQLHHIYQMLMEIDIKQKTGEITITTTDIVAFQFAIERFIFLVSLQRN